jgi:two-component system sensor histidine kinase RegB
LKDLNFTITRKPEIVHSLSNIIENAYQHAKSKVTIKMSLSGENIILEIIDNGKWISRLIFYLFLGEPYVKKNEIDHSGMGLGLFIAKNLINKSLGKIEFINLVNEGACVRINWKKDSLILSK